ncbi:MAG: NADH-quinone oxidoreductase subunit J, partial [Pseudomonadota bacterium]
MNPQLFQLICFYAFGFVTVAAALSVITLKNTVHAVLALVLTFFSAACLWMLIEAEFLALALIVVYVGAVMVLFLFVVMMLDIDQEKMREGFVKFLPVGLIVAAAMLAEMLGLIGVRAMHAQVMGANPAAVAGLSNTAWLGQALYTKFLLPFEIAALILTVGVVAA